MHANPVSGATVSAVCSLIFRPFRNDWPRREAEHVSWQQPISNGERAEAVRLLREEFDNHLDEFPYARQDLDLLTLNDDQAPSL